MSTAFKNYFVHNLSLFHLLLSCVRSESLVLLILYALYITLMYFNPPTERYVNRKMSTCRCKKLVGVDGRRGVTGEPRGDFTELANLMEEGEESDEDEEEEVALHMVNGNGSLKKEGITQSF